MVQTASDSRPFFGQSSRVGHGVRMRPMKYSPASKPGGSSIAISPSRIPERSSAMPAPADDSLSAYSGESLPPVDPRYRFADRDMRQPIDARACPDFTETGSAL